MTKILGITHGAHSSGIAYLVNGKAEIILDEERLIRIKNCRDFDESFDRYPYECMRQLVKRYNVNLSEIDAFVSCFDYETIRVIVSWHGYEVPREKYFLVDHHHAHAAYSLYFSGCEDDTLMFCADASGNNFSNSKAYIYENREMILVNNIEMNRKSFGHFYAALTELIGFKRIKDEGKVVGLSGHGYLWQNLYEVWKNLIVIDDTLTDLDIHHELGGGIYQDMYYKFFLLNGSRYWKNEDFIKRIAYTGQKIFEEKVTELITNLHKKYPNKNKLVLSGGIFANIKLNKRLNELDWVREVFILPPMGDEGLAMGCAISYAHSIGMRDLSVDNIYMGRSFSQDEVEDAAREILGDYVKFELSYDFIAKSLMEGVIFGLYQGRSEHGARALGNRSIICDATRKETYDILNGKLHRNDFMPFAPSVIDEDADVIFQIAKSRHTAEYMNILFDTREQFKDKFPTCLHPIDKTARIQIVKESRNKLFYDILKRYKDFSGYGILVNTSFNVHDEPIVDKPEDAFIHLRNGIVDLIITEYGIYKYTGIHKG